MNLIVRPSTPQDGSAVAAVSDAAFLRIRETYRPKAAAIQRAASLPPQTRLVAVLDGEIVGTLRYALIDDRVHLIGVAVRPAHQRCGVARAMIERVAELARDLDRSTLSLHTVKQTGSMVAFERMGFRSLREEVDDTIESDRHATLIDVYMERRLA